MFGSIYFQKMKICYFQFYCFIFRYISHFNVLFFYCLIFYFNLFVQFHEYNLKTVTENRENNKSVFSDFHSFQEMFSENVFSSVTTKRVFNTIFCFH